MAEISLPSSSLRPALIRMVTPAIPIRSTNLVNTINAIMQNPYGSSTAVIISYDDSDVWYDHQFGPLVTQSNVSDDQLSGPANCGRPTATQPGGAAQNGRCCASRFAEIFSETGQPRGSAYHLFFRSPRCKGTHSCVGLYFPSGCYHCL